MNWSLRRKQFQHGIGKDPLEAGHTMAETGYYEFGGFRLDAKGRLLVRGSVPVPLPPKAIDTLLMLVEKRRNGHR